MSKISYYIIYIKKFNLIHRKKKKKYLSEFVIHESFSYKKDFNI